MSANRSCVDDSKWWRLKRVVISRNMMELVCHLSLFLYLCRIETMKNKFIANDGGFATLRRLNEIVDFSTWKTKTPEASLKNININNW